MAANLFMIWKRYVRRVPFICRINPAGRNLSPVQPGEFCLGSSRALRQIGRIPTRMAAPVPQLVALPGAVGHPGDWAALRGDLGWPAAAFHALAAEAPAAPPDDGFASWTGAFLAGLPRSCPGWPRVLVGYSLGARLALHALLAEPSAFAAAILVSPHPGLAQPDARAARLAEDALWAARARDWPWADFLAAWEARPVFQAGLPPARWRPDLQAAWLGARGRPPGGRKHVAAALAAWSLGRQADLRPALARLATPTLWLAGAQDEKFAALAREAAAHTARIEVQILPGAGHRLPWEQPAAFAGATRAWLAGRGLCP
jgi:2-succinyl-6-hydroxy-2,4-cyclohexadiene-1-carboxylate synthase